MKVRIFYLQNENGANLLLDNNGWFGALIIDIVDNVLTLDSTQNVDLENLYLTGVLSGIHWPFIFGFLLLADHGSEYD